MRWNWRIVHRMAEPVATPKTRRGRSAARQGLRDSHSPRDEPRRWIDVSAARPQGPAAKPQDDLPKPEMRQSPVTGDLSRSLPEPIELGYGRRLTTLQDVDDHLTTLTQMQRTFRSWRLVEQAVAEAAQGGDIRDVVVCVKLARILDS
jgi:hypothetical protein